VQIEGKDALPYDKLLIASGLRNKIPNIKGLGQVNFLSLRSKKDFLDISNAIKAPGVKNITIIGGGFIGM
jgi:NADH dehydrogenase FAD-containing subunit